MRRIPHPRIGFLPLAAFGLALLGGALSVRAEPVLLTVGQGWAWVREFFPPSGEKDIDRIIWTNPPPQLDPDTLQVWNVRRPWPIQDWRWGGPGAAGTPDDEPPLVWRPNERLRPPPSRDRIDIRLAEPLSHSMGHSLTYRLPDFHWTAFYRVTVRGIGPESIDTVQVDLAAFLRIQNGTAAAYPDARISWVGVDSSLRPPPKPFGLLDLNPDTALTDLWLSPQTPAPLIPSLYPLQVTAAIPAYGQAEIQFARVTRKPAQITACLRFRRHPLSHPPGGAAACAACCSSRIPKKWIWAFPFRPDRRICSSAPCAARPSKRGTSSIRPSPAPCSSTWAPSTPSAPAVRPAKKWTLPEGIRQADTTVTLVNRLSSPVHVEVIEKPSTPMEWTLVRSSSPCTVTTRALHFDLTIPAKSTHSLTYRLRILARAQP